MKLLFVYCFHVQLAFLKLLMRPNFHGTMRLAQCAHTECGASPNRQRDDSTEGSIVDRGTAPQESPNCTERQALNILNCSKSFFHDSVKRLVTRIPYGRRGVRYLRAEIERIAREGFYE